jgi:SAM-dependent methyltransferase
LPTPSWINARYRRRETPEYPHQPNTANPKQWQPDVYLGASVLARALGAKRFVDIGCGNGSKTIDLAKERPTIGIDVGANFERARQRAPELDWREHDLQSEAPLPLQGEELDGSIIVNADVIEHLPDPMKLLRMFTAVHERVELILMSTPERQLTRGPRDPGPPSNPAHIQEWTVREFGALLREAGMPTHSIGLIRAHDRSDAVATIFVVIARNAEVLREADRLLIDMEIPPSKGSPLLGGLLRGIRGQG